MSFGDTRALIDTMCIMWSVPVTVWCFMSFGDIRVAVDMLYGVCR